MKLYFYLFCMALFPALFNNGNDKPFPGAAALQDDSLTQKLIIVNSFDVEAIKARKNKKVLFQLMADSIKGMIAYEYQNRSSRSNAIILPGIFDISSDSNKVMELQKKYNASGAIVVRKIDVYFEQKSVEVLKDDAGTHRNAAYDINAVVDYTFCNNIGIVKETSVRVFHYFATRSVMSGLFAAGPNIVSNQDAAIKILRENVAEYFRMHFPGQHSY